MPAWSIEGPRHAGITVSDLDRSLEFYEGLVGLELLCFRVRFCHGAEGLSRPNHPVKLRS